MTPPPIAIGPLLDRYDGILLDVYGVLLDARGALPGARELIAELARRKKPFAIVTNDASRSPTTYEKRFAAYGMTVPADRFVTSGSLLAGYLRDRGLAGKRTLVLGTDDSIEYAAASGTHVVLPDPGASGASLHAAGPGETPAAARRTEPIDALAICDDAGFDFLAGIEHAFNAVAHSIEAGKRPALVLPNPDLVYPKGNGELGFTAGAIALLVETALARRFPGEPWTFDHLGKPERHLFDEAVRRLGTSNVVMIGDQIETDIAGASAAGIDSALLAGVSRWTPASNATPTYLLDSIAP